MTKNINNLNAPTKQAVKAALSLRKRGRLSSRFEDESKVDEDIWGESNCCVKEYWAVMERNGTLVRGRNVLRVKKLSTGTYEVFFTGDVNNAAFNVTVGRPGISTEPPGFGCVALRYVDGNTDWMPFAENKGVWVQTFDANGKLADRAFHLVVMAQ